jgi:hypothetical protein
MARPRRAKLKAERLSDGSTAFSADVTVAVGERRHITLGYSREGTDRAAALTSQSHPLAGSGDDTFRLGVRLLCLVVDAANVGERVGNLNHQVVGHAIVDLTPGTLVAAPAHASRLQTAAEVPRRNVLVGRRHPVSRAIEAPHIA